ncbi:defensin Ec-AMP-D1-like [Gossypium australe]|uniref:Defensin Ec-AMP-D1-like n=1 Tax=Gossypium australe TaxID=47621 RepID=A0A5B6VFZ0_9ROSI|nr:defensin Ec-AMP-D1-like [Gossypium australe]
MERSSRSASALILLMLVLITTEIGTMALEDRICQSRSTEYRGMCLFDANCDNICKTEPGFTGGHCHSFFRSCYCTKPC